MMVSLGRADSVVAVLVDCAYALIIVNVEGIPLYIHSLLFFILIVKLNLILLFPSKGFDPYIIYHGAL